MALWRIVHDACVPHVEAGEGPKPCESVDLSGGAEEGVAILKDLVGVAQMLAIPTRRITGIEDPQMLAPDAPKVFFAAWKAKTAGRGAPSPCLAARGDCDRDQLEMGAQPGPAPSARRLRSHKRRRYPRGRPFVRSTSTWRAMTVPLHGRVYLARRVDSADLSDVAPLRLLAAGVEGASAHMAAYSLAAIGATFDGKPGFILLADQFSLEGGGHAEDLQDHDCAIARSAP